MKDPAPDSMFGFHRAQIDLAGPQMQPLLLPSAACMNKFTERTVSPHHRSDRVSDLVQHVVLIAGRDQ